MRVIVIIAGTNDPSNSAMLAAAFTEGMREEGAEVDTVHLREIELKHFTLDCYSGTYQHEPEFRRIQSLIEGAHGIVVATPIWNFGVPAHLKNLLDRMGSFAFDTTKLWGKLAGKPFYLIFTGGAPKTAWKGLMRITTRFVPEALKYFGATYINCHYEPKCVIAKGNFGLVVDKRPESLASLKRQGASFAKIVSHYAENGTLPLRKRLFRTLYSIGLRIVQGKKA
ncbi:MAG: NAD(P)H-dependent oxidoreductase [Candidatus Peregrinibacteria bacterium]|nr:NAD(P)H-dependent oxidoreductase [Candidatus Peregrinibacteria bacterium]